MSDQDKDRTFDVIVSTLDDRKPLPARLKRQQDGFSRMDVVNAYQNAFEMIGGTTRLALWANANPDKFYALHARLMPSTSVNITADGTRIIIEHAVPSSPLDQHPTEDPA
jgi:hypothetical protein